jgi:hypothetical protein
VAALSRPHGETTDTAPPEVSQAGWRFDPVDLDQVRRLGKLNPGERIQALLDARELLAGRGQPRWRYTSSRSWASPRVHAIPRGSEAVWQRAIP